jgi:hypothetical protein
MNVATYDCRRIMADYGGPRKGHFRPAKTCFVSRLQDIDTAHTCKMVGHAGAMIQTCTCKQAYCWSCIVMCTRAVRSYRSVEPNVLAILLLPAAVSVGGAFGWHLVSVMSAIIYSRSNAGIVPPATAIVFSLLAHLVTPLLLLHLSATVSSLPAVVSGMDGKDNHTPSGYNS